jgi:hypothetical protein
MEVTKAMEPWSVGKYAKRTATLHLGSEDQQSTTHSTLDYANVLVLGYDRAPQNLADALRTYISIVFWSGVAVRDPKFAQDSESGLRSRQSPVS